MDSRIAIYPHQGTYCQGDASPVSPVHEDPDKIDYAKLKLNTKELHGWSSSISALLIVVVPNKNQNFQ